MKNYKSLAFNNGSYSIKHSTESSDAGGLQAHLNCKHFQCASAFRSHLLCSQWTTTKLPLLAEDMMLASTHTKRIAHEQVREQSEQAGR